MDRYRPCRLKRNLGETAYFLLLNLVSLFVERIFEVLPFHRHHIYHLVIASHLDAFVFVVCYNLAYLTVIIKFLRRRVVLHEHHLRAHFKFQHFFGWISVFWEYACYLRSECQRLGIDSIQFLFVDLICLTVMRRQCDVTLVVIRFKIRDITRV